MNDIKISSEQKVWAAASYLWILSLVVLAARKNSIYVRFHANQGFLLFIISLISIILGPIGMLLNILVIIASVFGIIKALQGEKWVLPALGGIAKNLGDWVIKTLKL